MGGSTELVELVFGPQPAVQECLFQSFCMSDITRGGELVEPEADLLLAVAGQCV